MKLIYYKYVFTLQISNIIKKMNNFDADDAEAFLIEAELVHQKVKALAENRMTPEEFDKLQVARAEDLKRRNQAKIRKQYQAFQKKRRGRQGKGITKDFSHFCKLCRLQYELPTQTCLKCNKPTLSMQKRQEQLSKMVDQYKYKKKNRQQRKHKWQMWQKTQAMLWKKTSNNYSKWDYFVSDSEQEPQAQPIVPKNDPNFQALQRDMEQRKNRRLKDTEAAKKLKDKGNAAMKQGDYELAIEKYTLALEHIKDIKSIYTNRALAYIKIKKYKRAIKDCTNVIEYMEVFEKQGENKDLLFKAFTRRALAKKQMKQYKQALQDIQAGLKLFPEDKNAQLLKKQLLGFIQHTEKLAKMMRAKNQNQSTENIQQKVEEKQINEEQSQIKQQSKEDDVDTEKENKQIQKQIIKELAEAQLKKQQVDRQAKLNQIKSLTQMIEANPLQQIPKRINNLTKQQINALITVLGKNKDLISIFIASKGIKTCLKKLIDSQQNNKQALLICLCLTEDGVGQKEVWDFGVQKLHNKISQLLNDSSKLNMSTYSVLEDIFEILVQMSLYQKYREMIANSKQTQQFFEIVFPCLITKDKKQTQLLNVFLIYISNLCFGQKSILKNNYFDKTKLLTTIDSLFQKILTTYTKNRKYLDLKKNIYGLFSQLFTNENHRKMFVQQRINKLSDLPAEQTFLGLVIDQLRNYARENHNFMEYIEGILSMLVNLTMGTNIQNQSLIKVLFERYLENSSRYSKQLIYRALLIVSRLKYSSKTDFVKWLKTFDKLMEQNQPNQSGRNNMVQIVRILNFMYQKQQQGQQFTEKLSDKLLKEITSFISKDNPNEILYCNSCNLFGIWLDLGDNLVWKQELYQHIKPKIKDLVIVAKEKTGNYRKNAAILLAKCPAKPQLKQEFDKQHAMDVLKSIASFVIGK